MYLSNPTWEDFPSTKMAKKKISLKEYSELKSKLEEREKMHKQYMQLLENKFQILIPAKVLIGECVFNIKLTDADHKPLEQVKPVLADSVKVEENEKYIPSYVI